MSARKKTDVPDDIGNLKVERFFRAVPIPQLGNDWHPPFQLEIIEVAGDKIVKRFRYGKVDTKQMVMANMDLLNDPTAQENEDFVKRHFK